MLPHFCGLDTWCTEESNLLRPVLQCTKIGELEVERLHLVLGDAILSCGKPLTHMGVGLVEAPLEFVNGRL